MEQWGSLDVADDISEADARAMVVRGRKDPPWFFTNVLGADPWWKQIEIAEAVRDNRRTSVASCHSGGKSWIAARVVLWFLYCHYPSIVITTAPTDRQVRGILWKEIRYAYNNALTALGGRLLTQRLDLADDWFAWGFTAPEYDPDRFQGFHEKNVLVVVDEASGISEEIHDAIEAILASGNARKLEIGNPTDPASGFAGSFRKPGVKKLRISAFDTPNFTTFGITQRDIARGTWTKKIRGRSLPDPELVTPQWVADLYRDRGPKNPYYVSRVLAEFPEEGTDTLIPLAWIEAAQARELEPDPTDPSELGTDVARYGDDESVTYHRHGPVLRLVHAAFKQGTMTTTGHVIQALESTGASIAKVDVVGIGAGVVDRLIELEKPCAEMSPGSTSVADKKRFANLRAEWYWNLRELAERGDLDLDPDDEELAAQLSSIRWKPDSAGRVTIEKKEDMKKRGLKSPDRADAAVIAFGQGAAMQSWEVW